MLFAFLRRKRTVTLTVEQPFWKFVLSATYAMCVGNRAGIAVRIVQTHKRRYCGSVRVPHSRLPFVFILLNGLRSSRGIYFPLRYLPACEVPNGIAAQATRLNHADEFGRYRVETLAIRSPLDHRPPTRDQFTSRGQ